MRVNLLLSFLLISLWATTELVAQDNASEPDVAGEPAIADATPEIMAAIESFVTTFNARDADSLAAHWAEEGVYISRTSGDQVVGRESMLAEYRTIFSGDNPPTLAVQTESIEFISPNVALEKGLALVSHSETDVLESSYSVVYVKRDGAWLIDRVTEDELVAEVSNYEHLSPLEWLIGQWIEETESGTLNLNFDWTKNRNFISLTYKVARADGEMGPSGLMIIGWDPANENIRSWLFDSDGGFVSGKWMQDETSWTVQSVATLADGGEGSYTSILRPTEDGGLSWQKTNQVIDGELLPNGNQIVLHRQ